MDWEDCLKNKVKEIKPDPERAKSMKQLAERRMEEINKRRKTAYPEFIVEDYYETIKELITSVLYLHGFKSYSHECLITFLNVYYPHTLDDDELNLIDQLRQIRHDITYRGSTIAEDYLSRNEAKINAIIKKLLHTVEDKTG
jgi:uncharacterized protein (UPF0332 family)